MTGREYVPPAGTVSEAAEDVPAAPDPAPSGEEPADEAPRKRGG